MFGVGDGEPPARAIVRWPRWIAARSLLAAICCGVSWLCPIGAYGLNSGAIRKGAGVLGESRGRRLEAGSRGILEGDVCW